MNVNFPLKAAGKAVGGITLMQIFNFMIDSKSKIIHDILNCIVDCDVIVKLTNKFFFAMGYLVSPVNQGV